MSFHNSSFALRYYLMKMARPQSDTPPCYLFIYQCRAKMPELLQILDIPENSNLATMMMRTMSQCEESDVRTGSAGGHKTCVTSLEDMRQFVYTSLSPEDVSDISPLDRTTISSGSPPPLPSPPIHSFHLMNQHLVTAYFANKWLVAILALSLN